MPAPKEDPAPLDEIIKALESGPGEAKLHAAVHLLSVAHHPAVKAQVLAHPLAVRGIALQLMSPGSAAHRWELLALVGELCRRESTQDAAAAAAAQGHNSIAQQLADAFITLPFFRGAVADIATVRDEDLSGMAGDLLKALPEAEAGWTAAHREATKDLMFLDQRYAKLEFAPLVCRASRFACAGCGKSAETAAASGGGAPKAPATPPAFARCAACKAVFYCTADCQKKHWKEAHKAVCTAARQGLSEGFRGAGAGDRAAAFRSLFLENRAFLFQNRSDAMHKVCFEEYFMDYSPSM